MDSYSLQQVMKGVSNHYRIDVLRQLKSQPDLSVEELAESLNVGYKTLSVHLRKMKNAGLISKKQYGRRVEHRLTERGACLVDFLVALT